MKKLLGVVVVCFFLLSILAYLLLPQSQTTGAAVDVFKIAGEDYGYPSPYTFYPRGPGYCRMMLIFDTLVWKDKTGIIPWLGSSYQVSQDGRQWSFQIDPQAKWHDGKSVTADDVQFTFEYISKHPHPWFNRETGVIEKVEAKGKKQVVFYLKRPYAPFLTNIAGTIPIMPRHIWEKVADPLKYTDSKAVIGSGPFRLVKYDKSSALYIFQANPSYFKGQVKVNKLIFLQPGQPLMALQKGEIDAFAPNVDQAAILEKNANLKVVEGSGFWIYRLLFNLEQKPFNQVEFRQAMAYALNLPELVMRAMHNGATPGSPGYVSPDLREWYNPEISKYPHNPNKAKEILDSLGYKDNNRDGIREMPDGKKLSFEMIAFNQGQEAEVVKNMLKAVGIEIKIRALDKGAHDSLIANQQYEIALNGHGGIGGDPVFLNQLVANPKSKNHSNDMYKNPEYVKLANQQVKITNPAERKKVVDEMQVILAQDLPTIPLYYRKMYFAYQPGKVDDWFFTPGGIASGIPTELNKLVFLKR